MVSPSKRLMSPATAGIHDAPRKPLAASERCIGILSDDLKRLYRHRKNALAEYRRETWRCRRLAGNESVGPDTVALALQALERAARKFRAGHHFFLASVYTEFPEALAGSGLGIRREWQVIVKPWSSNPLSTGLRIGRLLSP